jgi:hypothetical protein
MGQVGSCCIAAALGRPVGKRVVQVGSCYTGPGKPVGTRAACWAQGNTPTCTGQEAQQVHPSLATSKHSRCRGSPSMQSLERPE